MFGKNELKSNIKTTEDTVECPVKECRHEVRRQRNTFRSDDIFKCPDHNIYISPSTFEYEDCSSNLLWTDAEDISLLNKIMKVKRESRMERDNSEDALSWNVFRYIERNNLFSIIPKLLKITDFTPAKIIYWSYCQEEKKSWSLLNKARLKFGETIARGSEPDIIIITNKELFFIEAKYMSGNVTCPSSGTKSNHYTKGGNKWFDEIFSSEYQTIAEIEKKYELMRFWLIGSWIAKTLSLDFYLVNLVLSGREKNIERVFRSHIIKHENRCFVRMTWEDIYRHIIETESSKEEKDKIIEYFKNKTMGYTGGKLKKTFDV